ncbi:MAG: sugar ABC transporter substrate-binding protein [Anaerolineae bacterium]|nr:sugar ABC transporter substrate-binding protein [Anaerolineae bacterium]
MSRKRLLQITVLTLISGLVLAACAPQEVVRTVVVTRVVEGEVQEVVITATPEPEPDRSKEPVTLRFPVWTGSEAHLSLLNGIAAAYQEEHPNVSVQYDTIAFSDYQSKVTIRLAGGDPPDAGWLMERAAPSWIQAGVLADLGPSLKQDPEYDYADLSEPALGLWLRGESVYGIPFSTSPEVVMYNRDLFEAAGIDTPDVMLANGEWTWEALAEAAKAIADATPGTYGLTVGESLYTDAPFDMIGFLRAYGGEAWSEDGTTCLLNTPESVKGIQLLHDMIFVDESVEPPGETVRFATGNAGMAFGLLSSLGELQEGPFEWDIVPYPSGPAGPTAPAIGQAVVVVFDKSPNKDVAIDFVAFMTNKENVAKLATFFPPARLSVLNSGILAEMSPALNDKREAVIIDGISRGRIRPSHPEYAKIILEIVSQFGRLWVADADVQAVLDDTCEAIAPYLAP